MKLNYYRIKDKLRRQCYKLIFSKLGYGIRVSKSIWNAQFNEGFWDYLFSKEEEAHYLQIIDFKTLYKPDGKILDVGCGQGVLFYYLEERLEVVDYVGVDISFEAVKKADKKFRGSKFMVLDFEKKKLDRKFDVIIFNETLYYFNNPLKKLDMAIKNNMNAEGIVIVSMCDFTGHDKIWDRIEGKYQLIDTKSIVNVKGQKWKVAVIRP